MKATKSLALIAGVLCCALAQAGNVYKYVDERGNTLYTDKPLPGAVLVSTGTQRPPEVAQRQQAAAQAATNAQLNASNQRIAQSQSNAQAASTVAKDLQASRDERCKKAQANYDKAISSLRLYRTTEDGTREYLTEAEQAQARVNALRTRDMVCGGTQG